MSDFLAEMASESTRRARETRSTASASALETRAASAAPAIPLAVVGDGFDLIAEAKLASPAAGRLASGGIDEVIALAGEYASCGAAAVSVLTEETQFAGSLSHLEAATTAVDVPVMRKDFLVDPIQVTEARAAGASGVLLIARMLPGTLLAEMTDLALSQGMFVLLEVFDRSDLESAARVFDRDVLVGVNCRDLVTLDVDVERFEDIAPHLPGHLPTVAESGITTGADTAHVVQLGYRMALVGSSLVTDGDPGGRLTALIAAGRSALTGAGT